MKKEVILQVKNLRQYFKVGHGLKKFEVKAVHNISFTVNKGEIVGLVGESGCGKTTTGRSIIKLYNITDGEIYFKNNLIALGDKTILETIKNIKIDLKKKLAMLKKDYRELSSEVKLHEEINDDDNEVDVDIAKDSSTLGEEAVINTYLDTLSIKKGQVRKQLLKSKEDYKKEVAKCKKEAKKLIEEQKVLLQRRKYLFVPEYQEYLSKENKTFKDKTINFFKSFKYRFSNTYNSREQMKNIQMIFQDPISSLDPRMTVMEIVAEGLRVRKVKDKQLIKEKVYKALELVGLLKEHANRYPHEFSGGQRQRIGIARALITEPELIIADEPVSALDVSIQAQVINLLNELKEKLNLTILFIAHDLSVVKYFSDRINVMYNGRIVESASSEELFKNPLHPYTRSLISSIPLPNPLVEKKRVRIKYNPALEHKWTKDKPQMVEIVPGHFVYGRSSEIEKYRKLIK